MLGHALTVSGVVYVTLALLGLAGIGGCVGGTIISCDASAYYFTDHGAYNWSEGPPGVPPYGYSPAFLWAFAPFRLLSFDAFVWVWAGLHIVALIWLRAGWMLAIPGVNEDVIRGNVTVFVAVAVVVAMRHPAAWAFPLLTKVLPGVGIVWHLTRREWTALTWSLGVTAVIVVIGAALQPGLWIEWVRALATANEMTPQLVPLWVRLLLAVSIVSFAARTSRAWLVPIGMLVGWSAIWLPAFMVLAAIPRLIRADGHGARIAQPPD